MFLITPQNISTMSPIPDSTGRSHYESSSFKLNHLTQIAILLLTSQVTASNFSSNTSPNISTPLERCTVSALIAPGHASVNFDCGSTYDTLGFYPSNLLFQDGNVALSQQSYTTGFGANFISTKQLSYASPLNLGALAAAAIFPPFTSVFKIVPTYYTDMPAQINDDQRSLTLCFTTTPCMVARIYVSHEVAMRAYQKVKSIQKALDDDQGIPLEKIKYNLLKNNCVDFMSNIMDDVTKENWRSQIKYTSPPGLWDKIPAIAWHYFARTSTASLEA